MVARRRRAHSSVALEAAAAGRAADDPGEDAMSATTIRDSIRSFVVDSFFVDDFADDDGFLRSGIVDSMGMLQLVTFLQERFGIEIRDEELVPENLDSLTRVTAFVERKLARRAG